jgi:hypothetical protein
LPFFGGTGEMSLDHTPAANKTRITGAQRPDAT